MVTFELDELRDIILSDNCTGFCIECGEESDAVEPDARGYKCYACGKMSVYGAEEIVLMGLVE